jgi:hypothetical protein
VSGPLLAEDGAHFTATIKRTEDRPQACYRVILDDGKRSMVERDIRLFKTDTEAIKWLALEADRRGFTRWQCVRE